MSQVIGAFLSTEGRQERSNGSVNLCNGSRFGAPEELLEFAVSHLDRVEVRRVFRQVSQCRSTPFDDLANARTHVRPAIVNHDRVTAAQRWTQTLLQIGKKHFSGHGSLKSHRRSHFVVPHCRYKGDRLPGSKRNATDHSDSPRSAPPEPHHAGGDSSFVKKHQSGRVKQALLSNPTSARASHICSLSLGSLQAFF
jgi:hypothetical protein